ncbi:hypothetical protein A5893_14640 [Pedobacter psychrophilus]|uniref:Uncharacterized protein n=1 Tax=Pedobacter psychrophilus TaxID=1826909 RepID=A0A179DC72_9SPHI|nr:hypothetical protein [Pedobacter psychrophilus]OAQ38641.1 hypothetical protein A5893_14640 [Pedobacter psychrophilus]
MKKKLPFISCILIFLLIGLNKKSNAQNNNETKDSTAIHSRINLYNALNKKKLVMQKHGDGFIIDTLKSNFDFNKNHDVFSDFSNKNLNLDFKNIDSNNSIRPIILSENYNNLIDWKMVHIEKPLEISMMPVYIYENSKFFQQKKSNDLKYQLIVEDVR